MREVKKAWLHEVLRQKELRTSDYARDMNLSPATVSGMLGGHRAVSDDTVDRTCAFYKVAPLSPIATAAKGGLPLAVTVDQHGLMGIGDQAYKHYRGSFSTDDLDRAHAKIRRRRK